MKKLVTATIGLGFLLVAPFANAAFLTVTDASQLDFSGDFLYALNFNGGSETIGDASFVGMNPLGLPAIPGVSVTNFDRIVTWGGASNLGTGADNDALERIMRSLIWGAYPINPGAIDLGVTAGETYRVQLLFSEGCCDDRNYTVALEDLAPYEVKGTAKGGAEWLVSSTQGYALSYDLIAADTVLDIDFNRVLPHPDTNYHISGLTVERIPEPSILALMAAGLAAFGFGRLRRQSA